MVTLREMQNRLGAAQLRCGNLTVPVTIEDYKTSYGNDRWLVVPVGGSGECWVETGRLEWPKGEN